MGALSVITAILIVLIVLAVLAVTAAGAAVRVLREYERGVVFRLGRLMEQRGHGLILLVPTIDRMVRVSLRTITLTVPPQEIITRDNIPARVTAVAYYRVINPNNAVTQVEHYHNATLQIAQTTLRSVLGGADLDTLLSERERLNEELQHVIDAHTEPWGIKVTTVEIKDVEIPESMQHAIARQAEAEPGRRARVVNAEGEARPGGASQGDRGDAGAQRRADAGGDGVGDPHGRGRRGHPGRRQIDRCDAGRGAAPAASPDLAPAQRRVRGQPEDVLSGGAPA